MCSSDLTSTIHKVYKPGDVINLAGKGIDNGDTRTVTGTPTSLTIDLKENLGVSPGITLTYKVAVTNIAPAEKTLQSNNYVKIQVTSTSGPFCLGFPDVYKVKRIFKFNSNPTSFSGGEDVTSLFTVDNGQRDTQYDLAYIKPIPGAVSLTVGDYLLVELD